MWQFTENKQWEYLKQTFDWVHDMHGVPQDPIFHAEGDVAIHTQMVLNSLLELREYQQLDPQQQEILWTAALMHDIEKRTTTIIEADGRITSAGHAKKGEKTVRELLYCNYPTPFEIREQIAKLVRYHGLPLWIFEKENPEQALIKASLEVNMKMLTMLARADVLGRQCNDKQELLYKIDLFEAFCQELTCWEHPKFFASNFCRFSYFQQSDYYTNTPLFDDTQTTVILMAGIAGSGKDTFIQKYYPNMNVISLDAIRTELQISPTDKKGNGQVVQYAKKLAKELLHKKIPFIWNATNITQSMRMQLIQLFSTYKASIKIVYLEVPYRSLLQQNKNRQAVVPTDVIHRMISKLEIPSQWEAHEVEYYVV